jgi:hypothetical protein
MKPFEGKSLSGFGEIGSKIEPWVILWPAYGCCTFACLIEYLFSSSVSAWPPKQRIADAEKKRLKASDLRMFGWK